MNKIRLGIIGAGSVVREIYQHLYLHSDYSPLLEIGAAADPNREYLNWFGDLCGLPADRRFTDYRQMLERVPLDAVQVNTPDALHARPTIDALQKGLDVVVPKPLASAIRDAHEMIETARRTERFLGVDFHKREDPRIKEAETRYQSGRYGTLQVAVWYMLDRLMVADPNHAPRFFATPDFAERNSPISFLTVHMADALMKIVNLVPQQARSTGYSQKLPGLKPVAVKGYDLVDTEIVFDTGALAHIITGWHLPNSAHALTVQSSRMICTGGMLDLAIDMPGYREIHPDGIFEVNPMFRNFEKDGTVTGYGIGSPGRLYRQLFAWRNGTLSPAEREAILNPILLGFYTTLVLEAAELSLARGQRTSGGVTHGSIVQLGELLREKIGAEAAAVYGYRQP